MRRGLGRTSCVCCRRNEKRFLHEIWMFCAVLRPKAAEIVWTAYALPTISRRCMQGGYAPLYVGIRQNARLGLHRAIS